MRVAMKKEQMVPVKMIAASQLHQLKEGRELRTHFAATKNTFNFAMKMREVLLMMTSS